MFSLPICVNFSANFFLIIITQNGFHQPLAPRCVSLFFSHFQIRRTEFWSAVFRVEISPCENCHREACQRSHERIDPNLFPVLPCLPDPTTLPQESPEKRRARQRVNSFPSIAKADRRERIENDSHDSERDQQPSRSCLPRSKPSVNAEAANGPLGKVVDPQCPEVCQCQDDTPNRT